VRQLRDELGCEHGTVQRVAAQSGCCVAAAPNWVHDRDVMEGFAPGPDAQ